METPDGLQQVIDNAIKLAAAGFRVSMPGRVQVYNSSRQTVDVVPMFRRVSLSDDPDEPFIYEDLPIVPDVPIGWFSANGGLLHITCPMKKNDPVALIFCDFDIGQYREKGQASEPGDLRSHRLGNAWAVPGGIRPNGEKLPSSAVDSTHMVLGTKVKLGDNSAAEAMIKGNDFALVTYNPHIHPTPVGPTGITTPLAPTSLSTEHFIDK